MTPFAAYCFGAAMGAFGALFWVKFGRPHG